MESAQRDYDLVYEIARDQLNTQLSFADALDAKIGGSFGISAALIGVLAAMVALRQGAIHDAQTGWLAGIQALCFIAIGLASLGLKVKGGERWFVGPKLQKRESILRYVGDGSTGRMYAARDLLDYYAQNLDTYRYKLYRMRFSAWMLAVQAIVLLCLSLKIALLP